MLEQFPVQCEDCGETLTASSALCGRTIFCQLCGQTLDIPDRVPLQVDGPTSASRSAITPQQIRRSLLYTLAGALPGTTWYVLVGSTQSLIIACLGTFVGFMLSLPEVSTGSVLRATFAAIVTHNIIGPLSDDVGRAIRGEHDGPHNDARSESTAAHAGTNSVPEQSEAPAWKVLLTVALTGFGLFVAVLRFAAEHQGRGAVVSHGEESRPVVTPLPATMECQLQLQGEIVARSSAKGGDIKAVLSQPLSGSMTPHVTVRPEDPLRGVLAGESTIHIFSFSPFLGHLTLQGVNLPVVRPAVGEDSWRFAPSVVRAAEAEIAEEENEDPCSECTDPVGF